MFEAIFNAVAKVINTFLRLIWTIGVLSIVALFFPPEIYKLLHITRLENIYFVVCASILIVIEILWANKYEIKRKLRDWKQERNISFDHNLEQYIEAVGSFFDFNKRNNQDYVIVKEFNIAALKYSKSSKYSELDERTIKKFRCKGILNKNNEFTLKSFPYLMNYIDTILHVNSL